jgi:hypothetical protein
MTMVGTVSSLELIYTTRAERQVGNMPTYCLVRLDVESQLLAPVFRRMGQK